MPNDDLPTVPDSWANSPTALFASYNDPYFHGDKLARDESIEFLSGVTKLKAYIAAVARLSLDVQAFEKVANGKSIDLSIGSKIRTTETDSEQREFQELQDRLKVLTLLQISAIHINSNFPELQELIEHIQATKDNLFEIALKLGDENAIRLLSRQMFESLASADLQVALLSRLNWLYPNSEAIAITVLDLIASQKFNLENPLEVLVKLYRDDFAFPKIVAQHVLENFTDFLPRNYNDLDQALLLRFIAPLIGEEHVEELYDRYIKLGLEGDNELELVIRDRMASLKNRERQKDTESLVSQFRDELSATLTIPEGWDLS